jgi:hypothetical protein
MTFELWSKTSRSIVGAFDTEEAALAAVRDAADRHGRDYAADFAVIRENSRGRSKLVAEGMDLVDRAVAAAATVEGRISA